MVNRELLCPITYFSMQWPPTLSKTGNKWPQTCQRYLHANYPPPLQGKRTLMGKHPFVLGRRAVPSPSPQTYQDSDATQVSLFWADWPLPAPGGFWFGLPGTVPVGSWQQDLESLGCSMSLLQGLAFPSPPWAAATSPAVPKDLHHPTGDVGGHQNRDGACWGPRAGKAMGASGKWGLSFHCCFCSSNCCAEIKAFVCLFSPTFLISLCAGLPYSPSSTFNL